MSRPNIKHVARPHLDHAAVIHCRRRAARNYHSHMFHLTGLRPSRRPHVHGPFPTRLVGRTSDRHFFHVYQFKFSLLKRPNFIGLFKSLQNHIQHPRLLSTALALFIIAPKNEKRPLNEAASFTSSLQNVDVIQSISGKSPRRNPKTVRHPRAQTPTHTFPAATSILKPQTCPHFAFRCSHAPLRTACDSSLPFPPQTRESLGPCPLFPPVSADQIAHSRDRARSPQRPLPHCKVHPTASSPSGHLRVYHLN